MAASQASTVSDSGATISRRPMADMPMPVRATLSSNFVVVSMGRTYSPKRCGSMSSPGSAADASAVAGRNNGSQTSSICSKTTSTG